MFAPHAPALARVLGPRSTFRSPHGKLDLGHVATNYCYTSRSHSWLVVLAGLIQPELLPDGQVRVDMGPPTLCPQAIPTTLEANQVRALCSDTYSSLSSWADCCSRPLLSAWMSGNHPQCQCTRSARGPAVEYTCMAALALHGVIYVHASLAKPLEGHVMNCFPALAHEISQLTLALP